MLDNLSRRLGKLEVAHGDDRHIIRVVVIPHGVTDSDRAAFIEAGATRLAGRPFAVIPNKVIP